MLISCQELADLSIAFYVMRVACRGRQRWKACDLGVTITKRSGSKPAIASHLSGDYFTCRGGRRDPRWAARWSFGGGLSSGPTSAAESSLIRLIDSLMA